MSLVDRFYSAAFSVGSGRFPGDIRAPHLPDVEYMSCGLRELNIKRNKIVIDVYPPKNIILTDKSIQLYLRMN